MGTADTTEKYAYKSPTTTVKAPSSSYDEWGTQAMWEAAYPNLMPAIDATQAAGFAPAGDAGSIYLGDQYRRMNEQQAAATAAAQQQQQAAAQAAAAKKNQFRNAAQILLQQRGKNPYQSLMDALKKNAAGASKTGADAVAALKAALQARQNPYANVQFNTPMAAANPLAAYMGQSGASTDQVDSLRNLLQSWSADAANADQQMASRLSTAWQNDQTSRLSDADTTAAAFKQALASNLATQQGALDSQYQQYYNDLSNQLAQLAIDSGYSLKDLGVTL